MNLRLIVLLTCILLQFDKSESVTCTFTFSTSDVWGYGCQLTNQVIDNESDLDTIHGEHMLGFNDIHVSWISSENSRISFFPSRLIEHFSTVRDANFDHSQMTSFGQSMRCGSLSNLALNDNFLLEIPDAIFTNCSLLKTLSLNRNNFGSIGEHSLYILSNLITLKLEQCNLSSIHPNAFVSLINLRGIYLSSNNLETLDSNLFRHQLILNYVRMEDNRITFIPENLFINTSDLRLNFRKNRITHIGPWLFSRAFRSNGSLDLSYNLIEELPDFWYAPGLLSLNLDNNRIKSILPLAFRNVRNLNQLRLSNNQIEEVTFETLVGLYRVNDLFLNANNISELKNSAFDALAGVRNLWLSDNQLTHLNPRSFGFTSSITNLNVERNRIESIEDQLFDTLPHLIVLNLTGNVCANESFTITWDDNDRRIIPRMGTCSSVVTQMNLVVLVFVLFIGSIF